MSSGHPSPKANDAFSSYFRFTPISEHFSESMKTKIDLFPKKFFLYSPTFSMTFFLVIYPKFVTSPGYFRRIFTFSPLFLKNFIFPLLFPISTLFFGQLACFWPNSCVFFFPLFWSWCIYASCNTHIRRPCTSLAYSRGVKPFQEEEGPVTAKARHWANAVLARTTNWSKWSVEGRARADVEDIGLRIEWVRYLGARPSWDLAMRRRSPEFNTRCDREPV